MESEVIKIWRRNDGISFLVAVFQAGGSGMWRTENGTGLTEKDGGVNE